MVCVPHPTSAGRCTALFWNESSSVYPQMIDHAAHKNPKSRLKLPVPKWMFFFYNLFAKVCEQCQIFERHSMFCVSHLKASKQGKTILYIGFKWLFLRLHFQVIKLVEKCSTSLNHRDQTTIWKHETWALRSAEHLQSKSSQTQVFPPNLHMTAFMNNLHKNVCCVWLIRPNTQYWGSTSHL